MINLNKLEKIAFLAFDNALRLHYDAVTLYDDGRFPSAYYLSILSQEELGKMHIINDFVWHSRVDGRMPEFEEQWLELLYKHPHKQHSFLRNSPINNQWSPSGRKLMQEVFDGALEAKKQGAIYVGLKRNRGKIDMKGKIKHPYQISKQQTKEQITHINDYLLVTGVGVRHGQFSLDNEEIEAVLKNKRFIRDNFKNWNNMRAVAKNRIRKIQKYFDEEIIPV